MQRQDPSFQDLSDDVLGHIFSYLPPRKAAEFAFVDKVWRRVIHDNYFWQNKFKRHFPDHYPNVTRKISIDWYHEFRDEYVYEYKNLSAADRLLFSLMKESDLLGLQASKLSYEDLNKCDEDNVTLFGWAEKIGSRAVLTYIYSLVQPAYRGRDVDEKGRTILYWAIACLQPLSVCHPNQFELKSQSYSHMKFTPAHVAANAGHLEALVAVLKQMPSLLNYPDKYGQPPLIWAASSGKRAVVRYLLQQKGIDINATTKGSVNLSHNDKSALHWAAARGYEGIVADLINAGAELSVSAGSGQIEAVHLAAKRGRVKVVHVFMTARPNLLNHKDCCNQTLLLWAASRGYWQVVEYLLQYKGIDLNASSKFHSKKEKNGRTALHWAACNGHPRTVKLLLDAGVKDDLLSGKNKSLPIHLAAQEGYADIVQIFLENKPELLNAPDGNGSTSLMLAISNGHSNVVALLLSQNAMLDFSKTIDTTKLNVAMQAAVLVREYIFRRSKQSAYKRSFTFFDRNCTFGYSQQEKLAAAMALNDVMLRGEDISILNKHINPLTNGELSDIYQRYFKPAILNRCQTQTLR